MGGKGWVDLIQDFSFKGICFLIYDCLRRLTFFQQLKKVSKKSRPSSAGGADFLQIPAEGSRNSMACQFGWFHKERYWTEWCGKSVMVWFGRETYGNFVCVSFLSVMSMFGCGGGAPEQVVVEEVWVRENIAPQKMAAAYLVLRNKGAATALVSAKTDVAEVTELHVVTAQENVMRMRKVEKIPIPAGGVATLQPGGNHLMLIGLRRDLVLGEKIDIALGFENGQTMTVSGVVKTIQNEK